jgi:phosphoserine aminotransferase
MTRPWSFAAGPARLPDEVLAEAADRLADTTGTGLSIFELPFTGPEFGPILGRAEQDLRDLLNLSPDWRVLFLQGGASLQFSAVPLNLLRSGADYLLTGYWSCRAAHEAARYGPVRGLPEAGLADRRADYCHVTTNETADGRMLTTLPEAAVLVADATSDLLGRDLDLERFGLVYASAQKNLGAAGLTLVLVREHLLGRARPETPRLLDYAVHVAERSKANTPPTAAVWIAGLMFQWLKRQGGVAAMARRNAAKAARLYEVIDGSGGFYRGMVAAEERSTLTVCFRLPSPALEEEFLSAAAARGLLHLKGHPAVGGLRACLYNAMPEAGVAALAGFMREFGG